MRDDEFFDKYVESTSSKTSKKKGSAKKDLFAMSTEKSEVVEVKTTTKVAKKNITKKTVEEKKEEPALPVSSKVVEKHEKASSRKTKVVDKQEKDHVVPEAIVEVQKEDVVKVSKSKTRTSKPTRKTQVVEEVVQEERIETLEEVVPEEKTEEV